MMEKPPAESWHWGLYWWLFLVVFICYFLTSSGRICGGDAGTMYQVTHQMVAHGTVSVVGQESSVHPQTYPGFLPIRPYVVETAFVSPGVEDRTYSPYGWGQSLFAIPFYILGSLLERACSGLGSQFLARMFVQFLNAAFLAGTVVLLVEFIRFLGFSLRTGVCVGFAFGFGTMVWPYAKTFYSEPAAGFFLLSAGYALSRFAQTGRKKWVGCAGLAFGLGIVFRVTSLIAVIALGLYLGHILWERRRQENYWDVHAVGFGVLGVLPCVVTVVLYNMLRFGQLVTVSYTTSRIGWDTPFLNGLYGLLFSPGKGLFIYNPVLLLGLGGALILWKYHRGLTLMVCALSATYVLFHAPYSFWTGGWNWGPRLLMPIIPFLMLPIAALLHESRGRTAWLVVGLMIGLGVVIQLPAVLVNHSRDMVALSEQYDQFYDKTIYELEFSPVVRQWPVALDVLQRFSRAATWSDTRTMLAESRSDWLRPSISDSEVMVGLTKESEFIRNNVPDFWWVYLYLLGVPFMWVSGAVSVFIGMGLFAAFRSYRAFCSRLPVPKSPGLRIMET